MNLYEYAAEQEKRKTGKPAPMERADLSSYRRIFRAAYEFMAWAYPLAQGGTDEEWSRIATRATADAVRFEGKQGGHFSAALFVAIIGELARMGGDAQGKEVGK